ncbi:Diacylglycerol kinase [Caligus rogercresseyi]|uniref:Diacylglycerol kinase n=1 Tax=Caligus rogercresseyi TaxID=217165 RepID=A0A7T8HGJ3_CALRO|nr:Diacylglycerol kinase [Caligus rogercresseyi]
MVMVFDLTQGGPQPAIEMFRKVPNIKLLACGGDGTVGWLLSVLDKIEVDPSTSVGVLPLGTGNDLSRSLGWGGGYIDEPISKILNGLQSAREIKMDRWILKVERNPDYPSTEKGEDELPLNVVNNYFSLGVDAQIALQFHEAREANPSKFNSRIRNKMFYGQAGGKDLLLRKWKDLSDEIEVECDGKDITPKLKEHRVHSVLFANIPSFGSGTRPWNRGNGDQSIDDGLIEVMGLTTYQLPLLQAGGHATCFTQCKTAVVRTRKTIPMQVDGEASRLNPATITLSYLNQVSMLAKKKGDSSKKGHVSYSSEITIKLSVSRISMPDYEAFHTDKDRLKDLAVSLGQITTTTNADLEAVRSYINKQILENKQSSEWCFIDSVTAIRFFRIDRGQETSTTSQTFATKSSTSWKWTAPASTTTRSI